MIITQVIQYFVPHRTHITGVINHAYGGSAFIDLFGWPHDANLVLNVLMNVVNKREVLPDVLYLQLDNTARENKNQYVMGFLALLVEIGIFKEVSSLHSHLSVNEMHSFTASLAHY